MKQRVFWAMACALAILGSAASALDPVTFKELSLFLRMGEKTEFIVGEVRKRRLLRPLAAGQVAELKAQGASDALLQEVQRPERLAPAEVAEAVEKRATATVSERFHENLRKVPAEERTGRDAKAVASAANTPMGRYHQRMKSQLSAIWQLKITGRSNTLAQGTVRVRCHVQPSGKVTDLEVLEDGGDRAHAEICRDVFRSLKLEPLPPEATPLLTAGALEFVFNFTIY